MEAIVGISHGKVRGSVRDGVAAFLGIPYAEPPFGAHRFAAPQPVQPWDGIRDALEYGPTAPKPGYVPPFSELLPDPQIPGGDCLNLNVWTPEAEGSGLPVLVWIHGGAFRNGSGAVPLYNGANFARDGVVCVTINYRLGVEGFAHLPGAPSNRGLLDQIAALTWVQENIAAFGGDPGNVTVFGESAGAMSVTTLLSLDLSRERGLFRRAISQSGAGEIAQDPGDALLVTKELAWRLGVEPTAEAFATLDPATIIPIQAAVAAEITALPDPVRWGRTTASSGMAMMPILDGELLTRRPVDAITAGAGSDVDLLIGYTSEEFRLFLVPTGVAKVVNADIAVAVLNGLGMDPALAAAYQATIPGGALGDALCAVITDGMFRVPAHRVAERHAAAPTYMYEFAWRTPERDMGACHALEIGFVFDNLHRPEGSALAGPNPPQDLATAMHRAWIDFATHGDPGWTRFDPETRPVKVFDGTADEIVLDPHAAERELWPRVP
ncbi:MAG: putative carboxylesterase [Actinomycetia bacterium]|nr:putative carboxylesterase [Actinomycetes bacterium]